MWTQQQLVEDLREIGLASGNLVLVHASLGAIGPIEGGPETLVAAFQEVLGSTGTLLVPNFTFPDEGGSEATSPTEEALEEGAALPLYDPTRPPSPAYWTSGFGETVRYSPGAVRSDHPTYAFAALGAEAEALTAGVPFHYPLGSDGPLARLHQRNGWILLIGVGHVLNLSLHLAEIWANVPYIHRSSPVRNSAGTEIAMLGSPDCSAGFARIEPVLRQSRISRRGYIGNAESQLMRQQQTVSMAIAMLQGSPAALLCEDENCRPCVLARRMAADQVVEPI